MEYADIELTDDDIKDYNRQMLPVVKDKEPIYSIVTRVRNHKIEGGDDIEIDIYLSGSGIPDANKLVFLWSSQDVVDISSPGVITYCIKEVTKKLNGEDMIVPVAGRPYLHAHRLDPNGITVLLNRAYFLPWPRFLALEGAELFMPQIMAERNFSGHHPISISLKTLQKCKSGDYEIDIVLTYQYRSIMKQACSKVEFRITNWWDRHQGWILTAGSIIAFILLVLTVINTWVLIAASS